MRPAFRLLRTLACTATVVLGATHHALSQDASKPLLSEQIAKAIDQDGATAGQRRFNELYPAHKDKYVLDTYGFSQLITKYAMAGNGEASQQIMQMMVVLAQDPDAVSGMPQPEGQPPKAAPDPKEHPLGPARDDLDRFVGLYGDPNRTDEFRTLFVAPVCGGYLVAGASFGDASPWYLRSLSDTEFETEVFGGQIMRFSFEIGPDGTAQALLHEVDYMPTPLPRVGPLPEEWQECVQPTFG